MMLKEEIRENLTDAGCNCSETELIMECLSSGDMKKVNQLIGLSRRRQLDRLHDSQMCIERLDYLSYSLKEFDSKRIKL